jgi:hypothetical protein
MAAQCSFAADRREAIVAILVSIHKGDAMSEWVTKSQVRQYDRCPYTFWLLYSGQITSAEVFGEMEKMLIGRGLGGHPKCTTRGQLKMYQGSVGT